MASFALLAKVPGLTLLPVSAVVSPILGPVTVPRIYRASRLGAWLVISTLLALLAGAFLRWVAVGSDLRVSTTADYASIVLWAAGFVTVPSLALYLSEFVSVRHVVTTALIGGLVTNIAITGGVVWKGYFGMFATMLALTIATGTIGLVRLVLLISVVLSATNDGRSQALFAVLAIVATFVSPTTRIVIRRHPFRFLLAGTFTAYFLITAYIQANLTGWLGREAQLRTQAQQATGNLLTGSRAEWPAGIDVFSGRPWGFGTGVVTPDSVQASAITAVHAAGGDYQAQYWHRAVFTDRHDFHSTLLNLWFHFGLAGVVLAAVIAAILLRALPEAVSRLDTFGPLTIYLIIAGAWDLFFSPMASNLTITLALYLAFAMSTGRKWQADPPLRQHRAGESSRLWPKSDAISP